MVKQGDIIQLDTRIAVVISNDFFLEKTETALVCPVASQMDCYPLHIPLDARSSTQGVICCERIQPLSLQNNACNVLESVPEDILQQTIDTIFSQIENI